MQLSKGTILLNMGTVSIEKWYTTGSPWIHL